MKEVIAICAHPENKVFLDNLMKSLKGYELRPIMIVLNEAPLVLNELDDFTYPNAKTYLNHVDGWELGALKFVLDNTEYDHIFFMQDSCYIKDLGLFDEVFKKHAGKSVAMGINFNSYLGKYKRVVLQRLVFPKIENKKEAVYYEGSFNQDYIKFEPDFVTIDRPFGFPSHPSARFEEHFGRENLVTENRWMIKYKGVWDSDRLFEKYPELK